MLKTSGYRKRSEVWNALNKWKQYEMYQNDFQFGG